MGRVYQYYQEPGHLFPYDIQFDVDDLAFYERLPDGTIRLRLITEPGFSEANVARLDGSGISMHAYARTERATYWETVVDPDGPTLQFTFALRFGSDRYVYLVPEVRYEEEIPRAPSAGGERAYFTWLPTARQP